MTQENSADTSTVRVVVFCFVMNRGKLLLIERAGAPYAGAVTVPGGHKRRNETLEAACVRELEEESGLRVHAPRFAGVLQVCRDRGPEYLCFYFHADSFSGDLRAGEAGRVFWADPEEALALPEAHPALKALLPFIINNDYPVIGEAFYNRNGQTEYKVAGAGALPLRENTHG